VEVAAHGGSRRGLDMCIICHQPQTVDPDTGNTVDMTVMTHKIHMGANLPSVRGGKPYQIIGNAQSVADFSKVVYPAHVKNCASCHPQEGANAGEQATNVFRATRDSCGSCHDNINFATGQGHLAQADDSRCTNCHRPTSEAEFDISVTGAHVRPEFSKNITGQTFEFVEIRNTRPGERPIVTFRLRDTATGQPVPPAEMTALSLVLSGPTSDYQFFRSETARLATQNPGGTSTYTFTAAIPDNLPGSYTVSAEGYRNRTFPGPGRQDVTVRDTLKNVARSFSTTGGPVEQRRTVVTLAKCNNCHAALEFHGRNRNQIEHCVTCHNPTMTDAARRPAGTLPAESINFGTMIHRIHTGEGQGRPYLLYGFGNTAVDFSHARFPADVANCATCHVNNSQRLPLSPRLAKVTDPRGWLPEVGPAGAACLGCHASRDAAVHVQLNTTSLGESCGVCHGPNADHAVDRVHAR
jgi:OmcA/MtrC family decaheme c-type cytochrome